MTKILKKSLACLLVFALCFTAIASCLAVSAAAPAAGFDFKTYFPNDSKVWAVCAGQNVRAQLSMTDLEAGATIGLSIEIPKGAEITSIDGWNWGTNCQLKEVSKYFNEEDSVVTIIYDVVASGNYMLFVRYNITDAVAKGVRFMDVTFEAAFASDDEITEYTVTDYYEVFDHDVVTDDAVAPGCETTGLTEGSHCSRCGLVLVAQEEVEAKGHAWDAGVPNPDATCDSEGTLVYTCANDASHTYTEAISAKGHTPAADLVNNGDNHSVVCDVCSAKLSTADHEYVDGTCACGAAEPSQGVTEDPNLKIAGASLGFGTSSLEMTFRIRKTVIQLYDKVELVITPQKYDTTNYSLATPVEIPAKLELNGAFYTYTYDDIQLYELGLNIDYQLKAYTGDELVAVSAPASTSPASYLKDRYAQYKDDPTQDKFRTLVVDTLIVCDKSVAGILLDERFANSQLAQADSVIKDFDISEASGDLVSSELNSKEIYDTFDARFGNTNSAANKVAYSVTIGKTPYIGFRVKDTKNALDHTKISFKVSYIQNKGKDTQGNMIEENYSKLFTTENTNIVDGSMITFSFAEIGIQDGNKDVFVEFYYDGEKVSELTYSVETYLGAQLSTSVGELATALLKLGRSFRAYSAG